MKYTKDSHITNVDEVKNFFHYALFEEHIIFHPDDPLTDLTDEQLKEMNATRVEMQLYDRLVNECFKVCERENEDIYGIFIDEYMPIFNKEMEELIK